MIATVVYIAQCLLSVIIGGIVFHKLKPSIPEWARFVIAGIFVVGLILGSTYLISSHSLVPGYRHFLARED